jgi:hypothetical protein
MQAGASTGLEGSSHLCFGHARAPSSHSTILSSLASAVVACSPGERFPSALVSESATLWCFVCQAPAAAGLGVLALAEIAVRVDRLENASVLHNHAPASGKLQGQQQPLHGCGEHFGGPHLAAELDEALLLIDDVSVAHHLFIPEPEICLMLRDGIAANFLSQG